MANTWQEKVLHIFAESGKLEEIPNEAQSDNHVSFETGYTDNYDKDEAEAQSLVVYGIELKKFNYLLNLITKALKEIQETIPVSEINGTQKIDISSIITTTNTFDVLESLLCIDQSTGKASKITKEELIAQLNPNINLSNNNISITELATTTLNNFLAIDNGIVKKANKLLQEVIEEIDLSANNVIVSQETTYDNIHKVLVTNTAGNTLKVDKLPQEVINNINLSADNISIEHSHTAGTTLKPLMIDENGKIKSEDNISANLIINDIYAKGLKTIVMTKEQYPNGINDLRETGLYSLASMDEYKDIVNNALSSERKEYITKVLNQILTLVGYTEDNITNLDITKFSDLIYSPFHQIQVIGVSQGETDNTMIQQSFILFGIMLGTRKGTITLDNVEFNNIVKMNGLPYIPVTVEKSKESNDIYYNVIDETSPITSVKELPYGWSIVNKILVDAPKNYLGSALFTYYKYKVINKDISNISDIYIAYINLLGLLKQTGIYAIGVIEEDNIVWDSHNISTLDLSYSTRITVEGDMDNVTNIVVTEGDIIKTISKNTFIANKANESLQSYYIEVTDEMFTDFNEITQSGKYIFTGLVESQYTNQPPTKNVGILGSGGELTVFTKIVTDIKVLYQIFKDKFAGTLELTDAYGDTYTRYYDSLNETWSEWQLIPAIIPLTKSLLSSSASATFNEIDTIMGFNSNGNSVSIDKNELLSNISIKNIEIFNKSNGTFKLITYNTGEQFLEIFGKQTVIIDETFAEGRFLSYRVYDSHINTDNEDIINYIINKKFNIEKNITAVGYSCYISEQNETGYIPFEIFGIQPYPNIYTSNATIGDLSFGILLDPSKYSSEIPINTKFTASYYLSGWIKQESTLNIETKSETIERL